MAECVIDEQTADYDTGDLFGSVEDSDDGYAAAIVSGLRISVLEKSGLALTLIADHIFSPALVLSEFIWKRTIDVRGKRLLELGCGTGLVGLVALQQGAEYVCLTDYDDESILACPRLNLAQNAAALDTSRCEVAGHTWGTNTESLLEKGRFDVVILADILWYTTSHKDILSSVEKTLAPDGEVWISSGRYTTCAMDFFTLAGKQWIWEQVEIDGPWQLPNTSGISNLDERKHNCLCWKMQRSR